MSRLHGRLERMHAKVRDTIALEVPGVPPRSLRSRVAMPYPADDKELVFFYGEGVVTHADFDYATTRLSDLLRDDGIETVFVPVSRSSYEENLRSTGLDDLPERRFQFLARVCGCADAPDTILSFPLFSPAVVSLTMPQSTARTQMLVV